MAREKYQDFTEEEEEKKRQYYCERYNFFSEDQKHKLVEYRRNYDLTYNKYMLRDSIRFIY